MLIWVTTVRTCPYPEVIFTVTEGKLADLTIVDGDPLADPELLSDPARIWLVLQQGTPVAGQALVNQGP